MTEQDLTQIGIEAFGIRRRLQQAIAGMKRNIIKIRFYFTK